jgi:hypothetical protein
VSRAASRGFAGRLVMLRNQGLSLWRQRFSTRRLGIRCRRGYAINGLASVTAV